MLPHGTGKLEALADSCTTTVLAPINGWEVDVWDMTALDVDLAVEVYQEVLAADKTGDDPVVAQLATQGIDLLTLLEAPGTGLDLVTRSDIAECAAAASAIARDGFTSGSMLMPNIPKMARRKSDSGVDVFDVKLTPGFADDGLATGERLGVASVKHTLVSTGAAALRRAIQQSISPAHELTQVYLAAQLRYVEGRLVAEGMDKSQASRTFLFMADFPDKTWVGMLGVAVIDPSMRKALIDQLDNLPSVAGGHKFRIITFPDLHDVHTRCP